MRVILDALLLILLSKKVTSLTFWPFDRTLAPFIIFALLILPPLIAKALGAGTEVLIPLTIVLTAIYAFVVWYHLMKSEEREWMRTRLLALVRQF